MPPPAKKEDYERRAALSRERAALVERIAHTEHVSRAISVDSSRVGSGVAQSVEHRLLIAWLWVRVPPPELGLLGGCRCASSSTSSAPRSAPSCSRAQAASSPARRRRSGRRGCAGRPSAGAPVGRGARGGRGRSRPSDPHRGLAHVSDDRADENRCAGAEGTGDSAVAAVGDDQRGGGHQLAVAEPIDQDRVGGDLDRLLRDHPVGRRDDAHRLLGERRQRRSDEVVVRVVRGAGRDEDQRLLPGGSSISGYGTSNVIGPVTSTPVGQRRGYSSWGKVPTSARSG